MDISAILAAFNSHSVDYLLIGGANILLRHYGPTTQDVDIWIDDQAPNRRRCEQALAALRAEWGESDETWELVSNKRPGWLDRQGAYCLISAEALSMCFVP